MGRETPILPTVFDELDTKAVIRDGRSFVPLRYLFEAFGYNVTWHRESKTVMINGL